MLKTIAGSALLLCLLSAPLARSADALPPKSAEPLPQVVVEATREQLVKLGKEVMKAEGAFYERYNELNKEREYAVNCYDEARTGTRFKRHYCQPVFENEAQHDEARNLVMTLQTLVAGSGNPGAMLAQTRGNPLPAIAGGMPYAPPDAVVAVRRPGFRKNMIEVTRSNPDLIELAVQYTDLVKRWADMYNKVNRRSVPEEGNAPPAGDSK